MALRTPPSWLQNGSHPAENDRLTTQALYATTGIIGSTSLAVTQNGTPNMSVNIAVGWAAIVGTSTTTQGTYVSYNDAVVNAAIATAPSSNSRIDLVCLTVNDAYYSGSTNNVVVNVVTGTVAASPVAPSTPANSIALAQVLVGTSVTSIITANITDVRVNTTTNLPIVTLTGTQTLTNKDLTDSTNKFNWPAVAGKNAIINGGMDIWQRGTSIALAASSSYTSNYTADRWQIGNLAASEACTVSRQATADTTNLPNIQYAARVQRNSGQTGLGQITLSQSVETINAIPFAGKQVTLSFYARAGANYSGTTNILNAYLYTGTGTDQNVNPGYAGNATPIVAAVTLTTTWQRFTATATLASSITELAPAFFYTPTGTAGTNDYFEITGVQLELGSTATTFSRAGGTLQGELAACQRYYQTINTTSDILGIGSAYSSTNAYIFRPFPVTMRATPSINFSASNIIAVYIAGTGYNSSAIVIDSATINGFNAKITSSGMTPGYAGHAALQNSPVITISAEL